MILFYVLFYLSISLLFRKYERVEVESLIHCSLSLLFSSYIFFNYFGSDIFTYKLLKYTYDIIKIAPELQFYLTCIGEHSIGYFISDTIYSIIKKEYTYIPHHLISILGIVPLYLNSYMGVVGIFYAELGGFFHHLKRFRGYFENNFIKKLVLILYFMIYSFSRILILVNVEYYFFYVEKYLDCFIILLAHFLVYQNLIW